MALLTLLVFVGACSKEEHGYKSAILTISGGREDQEILNELKYAYKIDGTDRNIVVLANYSYATPCA
ncbi:hypothetical protein OAT16_00365 [Prolixibacteraceae bacterium]|nr:hypothetical protein [Prolixibacteraceae bacterium]